VSDSLKKIFFRILQALFLVLFILPIGILLYKLIPTKENPHPAENIIMDPEQDDFEFQQEQQAEKK
jgi:hypothetical protein